MVNPLNFQITVSREFDCIELNQGLPFEENRSFQVATRVKDCVQFEGYYWFFGDGINDGMFCVSSSTG